MTHRVPQDWDLENTPFTFVTEGVERAIEQARAAAGEKNVAVDGASIVQQAIKAGLVDEIGIDLVPVLLGAGIRYFDRGHRSATRRVLFEKASASSFIGLGKTLWLGYSL